MVAFNVGDVVERVYFGGGTGLIVVESRDEHNGRPSFSGCVPGQADRSWGYDSQVTRVVVPRTASEWIEDASGCHTDARTRRMCAAGCGRTLTRCRVGPFPTSLDTGCGECRATRARRSSWDRPVGE